MKTYIWSLYTRVFHWMLVLLVVLAFVTSESEPWLNLHAAVGYGIGVLMIFRIYWGFSGPIYSRFSEWPLSLRKAIIFSKNIFHSQKSYLGHNPAASFVLLGIIVTLLLLTVTGILAYGIQEGRGMAASLNASFFNEMELFEALHENLSMILLILVSSHIIGIVIDRYLHPQSNTLGSIFTGYKNIKGQSIHLTATQRIIATVILLVALAVPIYTMSSQTILTESIYSEIDYKKEHPLFAEECASCHTLYPPTLLPKRSWSKLMSNLEEHFGDDASLEPEEEQHILAYLIQHAAEGSTSESSVKILQTFPNKAIIAVTKAPYWIKRHEDIDSALFRSDKIKSKANCKACHTDVEKGLLEDINIQIPTLGS